MFDANALARLTYEIVAIPSVTGDEAALADWVERRCQWFAGVAIERIGASVVARIGCDDAVAVVGHLDTVPPWDGHVPRLEGTRVIGRGAADMKGGVAAHLALLQRCAAEAIPLVAVFYDREEGPHDQNGIHAVLSQSRLLGRPSFAFVGEPTGCDVHAGAVGVLNADVVFRGRTGHAARPWEGDNAILRAAAFLQRTGERSRRPVTIEGLEFADTMCVTTAAGGVARNVVPDEFTIGLNVRFAPGRSADQARAEVEAIADGAEVRWLDESPPASPNLSDPTLRRFLELTGVDVAPKQAWTDVASLQAAGVPAVNFGPGDPSQAHQPDEWVDGQAVARVARDLYRFLRS